MRKELTRFKNIKKDTELRFVTDIIFFHININYVIEVL